MGHVSQPRSNEPDDIGRGLGVLLRAYREVVAPTVAGFPHGQRGYDMLREVLKGGGPSQLALANRLGIDRTVMTYLVNDLVAAGLVERRTNPDDRRQRQIVATDWGRKAVAALCAKVIEAEQAVLAGLDQDERVTFRRLLDKAASVTDDQSFDPCLVIIEAP